MKDEFKGNIICEFVGLKSKMYSLVSLDGEENRKTKGVNKYVATDIRHKEFGDVLFNEEVVRYIMKRIQSKLHSIGTYEVYKISLSCFDNKR